MKKYLFAALLAASLFTIEPVEGAEYGFINFKEIVDKSKMGKQEQASFETLKNQMEKVLEEKDKELNDLAAKFNDPDYVDSLSPEAENDLKNKFRQMSQDMSEKQNQFYQALQSAQSKIMAKLAEAIGNASKVVAKNKKIDAFFNQDATFFVDEKLNQSADVISEMDTAFDKLTKDAGQEVK